MRNMLRDMSIHSFQGYFYSKPVELETIISGLRSESGEFCYFCYKSRDNRFRKR